MNKTIGFLALFASGIILGSFGVLIRILSQELDSYQQIGLRSIIGLMFALTIAFVLKSAWSFGQVQKRYVLLYAISYPLSIVFFTLAILQTKIAIVIFALYVGTLLTAQAIGSLILHERLDKARGIALVLTFIGLLFFVYPSISTNSFNVGFILALLAGLMDGLSNSFRKFLAGKIDRFVLVSLQMLGGAVIAAILMIIFGSSFTPGISSTTMIAGLVFGALLMGISFLTLVGFQNFDLGLGTIVISSELFFAPLFAIWFFQEYPSVNEWLGGLFIVAAIVVPNIKVQAFLQKSAG